MLICCAKDHITEELGSIAPSYLNHRIARFKPEFRSSHREPRSFRALRPPPSPPHPSYTFARIASPRPRKACGAVEDLCSIALNHSTSQRKPMDQTHFFRQIEKHIVSIKSFHRTEKHIVFIKLFHRIVPSNYSIEWFIVHSGDVLHIQITFCKSEL